MLAEAHRARRIARETEAPAAGVGALALALRVAPVALALLLALLFQGARGLGEPDEGRNAQIAASMLATGDWLVPRLEGMTYLDKPPLGFWATAASFALFGPTELAARLPPALAYAAATAAVGWLGTMMWGGAVGPWCALAYALSLGPFAGSAVLTPDALLAAAAAWTAALFWRATRERAPLGWWLLAGAAAGTGLMIKGAAMLLLAAPLALAATWQRSRSGARASPFGWLWARGPWLAFGVALAVGLPWFLWIGYRFSGAFAYFLSNQVTGRLAGDSYHRNGQWWKVFTLYLPVLVVGGLPFSLAWPFQALARARSRGATRPKWSEKERFVALLFALPLVAFGAASSRLPLYLLPLFAPAALAAGRTLANAFSTATPRARRLGAILALLWIVALAGFKLGAARRVDYRDGRSIAAWIASIEPAGSAPPAVWSVDADLHSLPFYGAAAPHWTTTKLERYPMFEPLPDLEATLAAQRPDTAILVTPLPRLAIARAAAGAAGLACDHRSTRLRLALLVCARR
jgi:4-amino-4-deoxy-L-arabinose transferase